MRKSLQQKTRSKSKNRNASADLADFIKKQYPTKIPIATLTGMSKLFAQRAPLNK
jgi:hypothetical protein